jgi:hypothetical protein
MVKDEASKEVTEGIIYNGDPAQWYSYEREIRCFMRKYHGVVGMNVWDGNVGAITTASKAALRTLFLEDLKKRRGRKEAS